MISYAYSSSLTKYSEKALNKEIATLLVATPCEQRVKLSFSVAMHSHFSWSFCILVTDGNRLLNTSLGYLADMCYPLKTVSRIFLNHINNTRLKAFRLGLPGRASTKTVKPIWILLKQQTVSGSGISWAICKSAPRPRQITTPACHHSVFTGWMLFTQPTVSKHWKQFLLLSWTIYFAETFYHYFSATFKVQICMIFSDAKYCIIRGGNAMPDCCHTAGNWCRSVVTRSGQLHPIRHCQKIYFCITR